MKEIMLDGTELLTIGTMISCSLIFKLYMSCENKTLFFEWKTFTAAEKLF